MSKYVRKQDNHIAKRLITVVLLILAIVLLISFGKGFIYSKEIIYETSELPKTYVGYKICVLSNLDRYTDKISKAIDEAEPDLVLLIGDIDKSNRLLNSLSGEYNTVDMTNNSVHNDCIQIESNYDSYDKFVDKYIGNRYLELANGGNKDANDYLKYTKDKLEKDKNKTMSIFEIKDNKYVYDLLKQSGDFRIAVINNEVDLESLNKYDINLIISSKKNNKSNSIGKTTIVYCDGIDPKESVEVFRLPEILNIILSDGTITQYNPIEKLLNNYIVDVDTRFKDDTGFNESVTWYD